MKFIWAPLGANSFQKEGFNISVLNIDGKPNKELLRDRFREAANKGAHAVRDFSWYWDKGDAQILSPFRYVKEYGKFDLSKPNPLYYETARLFAQVCKEFNLEYHHNLFDQCSLKYSYVDSSGAKHWPSPWKNNEANETFYEAYPITYVRETVLALADFQNVKYEICNEPVTLQWMAPVIEYLHRAIGYNPVDRIITGIDYYMKEIGGLQGEYKALRERMDDMGYNGGDFLRSHLWSVVHGVTIDKLKVLFHHNTGGKPPRKGHNRNVIFSADGTRPRLTRAQTKDIVNYIYAKKPRAIEKGRYWFEVVGGKETVIPIYQSLEGAVDAFKENTGRYPENYGQFEKKVQVPVKPPNPDKPVKPERPPVKSEPPKSNPKPTGLAQFLSWVKGNRKTAGIILIAIFLLILLLTGCKQKPDPAIKLLQETNQRLQAENAELFQAITATELQVLDRKKSIDSLARELEIAHQENAQLQKKIDRIRTKKPEQVNPGNCQEEYAQLFQKEQACFQLTLNLHNSVEVCKSRALSLEKTVGDLEAINADLKQVVTNHKREMENVQAINEEWKKKMKKKKTKALKTGAIAGIVVTAVAGYLLRR